MDRRTPGGKAKKMDSLRSNSQAKWPRAVRVDHGECNDRRFVDRPPHMGVPRDLRGRLSAHRACRRLLTPALAQHAREVFAHDLASIPFRVAALEQSAANRRNLTDVLHSFKVLLDAVLPKVLVHLRLVAEETKVVKFVSGRKVEAKANVIDTDQLNVVIDVIQHAVDVWRLATQERAK